MQTPLKITFRHMTPSDALEAHVREHVENLERVYDRIIACDVVIDAPAGRHASGESFDVRIHLTVPNGSFNVCHDRPCDDTPLDAYAAVREAFGSLERMLGKHRAIRRESRARPEARFS